MRKVKKYILALLQNPILLVVLWFGMALQGYWKSWTENFYNNYLIFSHSFCHAIEQTSLYSKYPNEYFDIFLYGIPFTAIVAPFSLMPPMVGSAMWCFTNAFLLYWALHKLNFAKWQFALIIWLSYYSLYIALLFQQYSIAITAFIMFSFILIEKKKDFWAALFIVLGTITKIYGIVGLAFFFFSKRKLHLLSGLLFWGGILFLLPMCYSSPHYVITSYYEWIHILIDKNSLNIESIDQNISLVGMVRKLSGGASYSDLWLIIPALFLFMLPYLRINQYDNKAFRLSFLASVLLFVILFSTGTEECGYVMALMGVGIWYVSTPTRKSSFALNLGLLILCIILTSFSSSGFLFSKYIRENYIRDYMLKALPCTLIWIKIIWEQITQDFTDYE